jgi:hypothetical protein
MARSVLYRRRQSDAAAATIALPLDRMHLYSFQIHPQQDAAKSYWREQVLPWITKQAFKRTLLLAGADASRRSDANLAE